MKALPQKGSRDARRFGAANDRPTFEWRGVHRAESFRWV